MEAASASGICIRLRQLQNSNLVIFKPALQVSHQESASVLGCLCLLWQATENRASLSFPCQDSWPHSVPWLKFLQRLLNTNRSGVKFLVGWRLKIPFAQAPGQLSRLKTGRLCQRKFFVDFDNVVFLKHLRLYIVF